MQIEKFNALITEAESKLADVLKQRTQEYGSFQNIAIFANNFYLDNYKQLQSLFNNNKLTKDNYIACEVAVFMLGIKLARIKKDYESPHLDSAVDFLGYLKLFKSHLQSNEFFIECFEMETKLTPFLSYANKYINNKGLL